MPKEKEKGHFTSIVHDSKSYLFISLMNAHFWTSQAIYNNPQNKIFTKNHEWEVRPFQGMP